MKNLHEIEIKSVRKLRGTLKLYFNPYCEFWTISWTAYLSVQKSDRKVISAKLAAHIIENVLNPF